MNTLPILNRHESFTPDILDLLPVMGEASFNVAMYERATKSMNLQSRRMRGCGITIDSDHQKEYQESLDKLKFQQTI